MQYDFVDSVVSDDMDGRWGSNADGSSTYDHESVSAYSEYDAFLRRTHPRWFATAPERRLRRGGERVRYSPSSLVVDGATWFAPG